MLTWLGSKLTVEFINGILDVTADRFSETLFDYINEFLGQVNLGDLIP
jgi:hypothetical protein